MQKVKRFGVHQAKTNFSKLLRLVERGEEVVITRGQIEVATLRPLQSRGKIRVPGSSKGECIMKPDFFDALPLDLQRYFG